MRQPRPKYLDLRHIHLPLPGWVSILHRFSGVLLFLALPLLLWMLQCSLRTPETCAALAGAFSHAPGKIFLIAMGWAFLHHFFAGIRCLGLDLGWGVEPGQARGSSLLVLAASLLLTVWLGVCLW